MGGEYRFLLKISSMRIVTVLPSLDVINLKRLKEV